LASPVLLLSRLARIAATVGCAGGALGVYGRLSDVRWATVTGTALLFGGAIVYFFERVRMSRRIRGSPPPR
jgi:hypothetical protein